MIRTTSLSRTAEPARPTRARCPVPYAQGKVAGPFGDWPGAKLLLFALVLAHVSTAAAEPKKKGARPHNEVDEQKQFIEHHFEKWDINKDGSFDVKETNLLIRREGIRGREAAMVVAIHLRLRDKNGPNHFTRDECVKLAEDNVFRGSVFYYVQRVEATDHVLFLPGDPKLTALHQGWSVGDCYYIATIGAAVHLKPEAIRDMIRPVDPSGKKGYEVAFGCGKKIVVSNLTDSELMLGSDTSGDHGIWLAVLEKAYGLMRTRASAKAGIVEAKSSVPVELVDGGFEGKSWPVISLFTGHVEQYHDLKKEFTPEKLHHLLIELTKRHRLVRCDVGPNAPPGMGHEHSYGLLGYDSSHRLVKVFNPWGNDFKPDGPAGPTRGYVTEHGTFVLPLTEFQQVFERILIETDQPWHDK